MGLNIPKNLHSILLGADPLSPRAHERHHVEKLPLKAFSRAASTTLHSGSPMLTKSGTTTPISLRRFILWQLLHLQE